MTVPNFLISLQHFLYLIDMGSYISILFLSILPFAVKLLLTRLELIWVLAFHQMWLRPTLPWSASFSCWHPRPRKWERQLYNAAIRPQCGKKCIRPLLRCERWVPVLRGRSPPFHEHPVDSHVAWFEVRIYRARLAFQWANRMRRIHLCNYSIVMIPSQGPLLRGACGTS